MPDLDLDALEALLKRATAAPWKWIVNRQHKAACLMNERHQYVVDFARWGTGGARPRFRCTTGADLMVNADEFAQDIPGREHHSAWHQAIRHPDADLIVAIRNAAPALIAAARERDELRDRAKKAERERDEARETNRRLNRRCQRSEALPKFHELGLADELRSAVWHLRYRYRCAASAARSIERMWADNSASHYANLIREWAGKGRPPNHTLSHFDSIVDEMRADKAALAAATSRAEKAEKERDEAATAAKVKADLLATATAALGDATARAERAEKSLRDATAAERDRCAAPEGEVERLRREFYEAARERLRAYEAWQFSTEYDTGHLKTRFEEACDDEKVAYDAILAAEGAEKSPGDGS